MTNTSRVWRPYGLATLLAALLVAGVGCGQADGSTLGLTAVLNGVHVADTAPRDPVVVRDDRPAELQVTLANPTSADVEARYILFEGHVIDSTFLTYDTAIRVTIPAGSTVELPTILLDFYDLGAQANGYLRGQVAVFDRDRQLLAAEEMFFDADGSGMSTLTMFNLVLLLGTALGLGWNLLRLAQRRLPANRAARAVRFLAVGAAAGLTVAVAFSTLRIWPLDTLAWVLIAAVAALIGYVVGFVLPGADDADVVDLLDDDELIEAIIDRVDETDPDTVTTTR